MSCLCKIFSLCHAEPEKRTKSRLATQPIVPQAKATNTARPLADASPTGEELPRIRHFSATLEPRMLAPLPADLVFTRGGSVRRSVYTLKPEWDGEDVDENDIAVEGTEHQFIYEGANGVTWPVRRTRVVDGKPVETRLTQKTANDDADAQNTGASEEINRETTKSKPVQARPDKHKHDSPITPSSPANPSFPPSPASPPKLRLRVRNASAIPRPAGSEPPRQRLRVRVRSAEEMGNESARRLPRRRGMVKGMFGGRDAGEP